MVGLRVTSDERLPLRLKSGILDQIAKKLPFLPPSLLTINTTSIPSPLLPSDSAGELAAFVRADTPDMARPVIGTPQGYSAPDSRYLLRFSVLNRTTTTAATAATATPTMAATTALSNATTHENRTQAEPGRNGSATTASTTTHSSLNLARRDLSNETASQAPPQPTTSSSAAPISQSTIADPPAVTNASETTASAAQTTPTPVPLTATTAASSIPEDEFEAAAFLALQELGIPALSYRVTGAQVSHDALPCACVCDCECKYQPPTMVQRNAALCD